MRFVSLVNSVVGKTRQAVAQTASVQDLDVKDPENIGEQLRQLTARLNKLEAAAQPEATEFEVDLGDSGALVELPHSLKTRQVRWSVVGWFCKVGGVSPAAPPNLVYDPSSTPTSLFLRSYVAGRGIIRVEPSQNFLDTGNSLDAALGAPLGVQRSGKRSFNDTLVHNLITIPVPDNSACVWRVCVIGQDTTTLASRAIVSWYMHARRQLGAGVIDLVNVTQLASATANYAATAVVSGNNITVTGQRLAAASPVTWTAVVEPVLVYLRDE